MKKLMLFLFAVCSTMVLFASNGNVTEGTLFTAQAINLETETDPAEKLIEKLNAKITLTAQQEADITSIAQDYSIVGLSKADRRIKVKAFRKKVNDDVLTDAQKAELALKRNN